jgi:hypothetical protein
MKNTFLKLFIPLLIVLVLIVWVRKRNVEVSVVRSSVDGREYVVQNKQDRQQAADTLARVRARLIRLIDYLKQTGGRTDQRGGAKQGPRIADGDERRYGSYEERVKRLVRRFNPNRISEGNEDVRYTTYTLNKGEKIVFCLRARDEDDRVHDLKMMTFVAIHELAHIASKTEHHTPEFQANFAWLLRNAVNCGVYTFEDFKARPRRYCGIDVTDTPLSGGGGGIEHFILGLLGKEQQGWCSRCRNQ